MAEFYRFFDSTINDKRLYNADEFAEYFRRILTNGIFNGGENLKVSTSGSNMEVSIADGFAWINGYLYKVEGGLSLTVEPAHPTQSRIDRVVIRWDKREEARYIKAFVVKGEASEEPAPPELTRTSDVFELSLAQVFVEAGKSFLPSNAITDERLNTKVCGLVNSLIQADTTEIFNQFDNWYKTNIPEFEQRFETWYSTNVPKYEKRWSEWYDTNIPEFEKQWSEWFTGQTSEGFVLANEKGTPNGVATLDEHGKLPLSQFNTDSLDMLKKQNNEQNKEIAFLKLKQKASDRIEGGTTFADDMKGNGFGITFNEELSENVVIKDGALTMNEGSMVEHNIDDSMVVSGSSYSTLGNGGRKLVRLDNGTLVCAVKKSDLCELYKSVDNGKSWTSIFSIGYGTAQDVVIQTNGVYIYWLTCNNNSTVDYRVFDENGKQIHAKYIQTSQTALGKCSLAINEEGTELHACWSSLNTTYRYSHNIQYCKGIIGEGGSVTWGSVTQVTSMNSSTVIYTCPTITLNSLGRPVIIHEDRNGSFYKITARIHNGSSWDEATVYNAGSYAQEYPTAIFVPESVNGLENGRIWVTWHGEDSSNNKKNNIKVSYSDNDGVSWSTAKNLTSDNTYDQHQPSITVNNNNEVFITWHGSTGNSPQKYVIRQVKWSDGVWGNIVDVKQLANTDILNTSTLYDTKWNTNFTKPLLVYTVSPTSINFTGSWKVGSYTPTTTATAVYNLPKTDYVGMFVQKEGNVNIEATINDIPMDSELNGNEYQFTKALASEAPVTLKLSLSRDNTTNGNADKVTRILGGMS